MMRERLGAWLIRLGLRLISDRHAWWLYQVQRDYWTGEQGRRVLIALAAEEQHDGTDGLHHDQRRA